MNNGSLLKPFRLFRPQDAVRTVIRYYQRRSAISAAKVRFVMAEYGLGVTTNDRGLAALKNKHHGQRCFIIGNGPSLQIRDLNQLENEITFASNKIYLAFAHTAWRPSYYTVCDFLVAQNNREEILETDFGGAIPIHSTVVEQHLGEQEGALFYDYRGSIAEWHLSAPAILPEHPIRGIFGGGYSVVIDQIQLACTMGFTQIFLIGVDFSFSGGAPTGRSCVSGDELVSRGECNHFHPDYRKPGETWTVPRLKEQEHAFRFCRRGCERAGRKLANASRKSALTVIERVPCDGTLFRPET